MRLLALVLLLCTARPAAAQWPIRTAAGADYRARGAFGWLVRILFGDQHRDLWATPIDVRPLALDGEGYTLVGVDTALLVPSLDVRAEDGTRNVFTPMDPRFRDEIVPVVPHPLVAIVLQDVISARRPGAPLVAARLAEALGLRFDPIQLRYLTADYAPDPRFAGQIGYLTPAHRLPTLPAQTILDSLNTRAAFPIDTLAYLRDRMLDLWVGATNPVPELTPWERGEAGWRPAARVRNGALAKYGGIVSTVTRPVLPGRTSFASDPDRIGLTPAGEILDDRLIAPLAPVTIQNVAKAVTQVPDDVVDDAVRALPAPWRPDSIELAATLRLRRDSMLVVARTYYARIMENAVVHAPPGTGPIVASWDSATLTVTTASGSRPFVRPVTNEVRVTTGEAQSVVLRGFARDAPELVLLGARSRLTVIDSASGAKVSVHDSLGATVTGAGSDVDVKEEALHEIDLRWSRLRAMLTDNEPVERQGTLTGAWMDFTINGDYGILAGVGPAWTHYEPGRDPFAWRLRSRLTYSTSAQNWRVQAEYDYRRTRAPHSLLAEAMSSGIEVIRFFGYGNETEQVERDADAYLRRQRHNVLGVSAGWRLPRGSIFVGPVLKYVSTDLGPDGSVLAEEFVGLDDFGQLGVRTWMTWDSRDFPFAPTRGLNLQAGASWYPALWDVEQAFGEVHGAAGTHITPVRWLTLSPRVGIKHVRGGYPVHESAFLGGYDTERGLLKNRYAGDTSAWLNTDTRVTLTTIPVLVDWDFGVLGVFDVGRVWYRGEQSEKWHPAWGVGAFAILPDRSFSGVGYFMFAENHVSITGGIDFYF